MWRSSGTPPHKILECFLLPPGIWRYRKTWKFITKITETGISKTKYVVSKYIIKRSPLKYFLVLDKSLLHEKNHTITNRIHEKILSRKCSRRMNKTIVSCQPPLRFFYSTELWLPVLRKLKTLSPIEKFGGQQNYFQKMSVIIIQLDEIKNMNPVTIALRNLLLLTANDIHGSCFVLFKKWFGWIFFDLNYIINK
mgnify:CR=1 FL=1